MRNTRINNPAGWWILLLLGLLLHLAGIGQPFLGNFAQHQTDYATVVQRWLDTGISPFKPMMRFIGEGTNRFFYGDFPLTMTLTAYAVKWTGLPIELVGRGLTAFLFILSLFPFYRILQVLKQDPETIRWALFFYAFSPLTLVYGQAFLLEVPALCFALFGFYFLLTAPPGLNSWRLYAAAGCFSLMLALRLYYASFLPAAGALFWNRCSPNILGNFKTYILFLILLALPVGWQVFASSHAASMGEESSLLDNLRVFVLADPITGSQSFTPRYYLPIWDTFVHKVATPVGFALFVIGSFLERDKNEKNLIRTILLLGASFIPLFLIAVRKFVEFEYYFLPFVPLAAILAGGGLSKILRNMPHKGPATATIVLVVLCLSLRYSISPMLHIPDEDRYVLEAAQTVRNLVPPDARIIASHGSSTSFLYHTGRDGWAFYSKEGIQAIRNLADFKGSAIERLERFRSQGAEYFALADKRQIVQNPSFFDYLSQHYKALYESGHLIIFSLAPLSPKSQMNNNDYS